MNSAVVSPDFKDEYCNQCVHGLDAKCPLIGSEYGNTPRKYNDTKPEYNGLFEISPASWVEECHMFYQATPEEIEVARLARNEETNLKKWTAAAKGVK